MRGDESEEHAVSTAIRHASRFIERYIARLTDDTESDRIPLRTPRLRHRSMNQTSIYRTLIISCDSTDVNIVAESKISPR